MGVDAKDVTQWMAQGYGPFEAALAQGDGFTPTVAPHYRHQLARTALAWERANFDHLERLRWHRAGFAVADALRWRAQGVDVATARLRRDGYDLGSGPSEHSRRVRGTDTIDEQGA